MDVNYIGDMYKQNNYDIEINNDKFLRDSNVSVDVVYKSGICHIRCRFYYFEKSNLYFDNNCNFGIGSHHYINVGIFSTDGDDKREIVSSDAILIEKKMLLNCQLSSPLCFELVFSIE